MFFLVVLVLFFCHLLALLLPAFDSKCDKSLQNNVVTEPLIMLNLCLDKTPYISLF